MKLFASLEWSMAYAVSEDYSWTSSRFFIIYIYIYIIYIKCPAKEIWLVELLGLHLYIFTAKRPFSQKKNRIENFPISTQGIIKINCQTPFEKFFNQQIQS